ncbi:hypothetical protein [Cytobacillus firmus]|uniref:Core-binding (CB) domain-containing protein n=1 Tax=Cytobacillus firmus DS1 TaxID=1307436 RepID=W7L8P8_CYTFI|nr:hypothetical protein [Cytobacillus firmus]EWG11607.1 hypothetical protein PBF_08643 [Cytobacillus firmus DS1]
MQQSTFANASLEFLKHCRIKGLSSETVKFYQKELKQTLRGLADIEAPVNDIRKISTEHIENFIEYQQEIGYQYD